MKMGIIGYGYWGPNIVRNFMQTQKVEVTCVCDLNNEALKQAKIHYPQLTYTNDYLEIINAPQIDAVAIVTPVFTHYKLAKEALTNNKHIFIEKPFTSTVQQAEELIELAEKKGLIIMIDHTFLFTGAVTKIKELINIGALGELYYYDSTRVNLGLFQHDVNVIWDLAPHDFSIMNYIIEEKPKAIAAHGTSHFKKDLEDIAYITVYFSNNLIAHFNVNWISPVKLRSTFIGGNKKMLIWNDLEFDEKIKIYDKGLDLNTKEGIYEHLVSYRSGNMFSPKVEHKEALKVEAEYFTECIYKGTKPFNNGHTGLEIVKMLCACNYSLQNNGMMVEL